MDLRKHRTWLLVIATILLISSAAFVNGEGLRLPDQQPATQQQQQPQLQAAQNLQQIYQQQPQPQQYQQQQQQHQQQANQAAGLGQERGHSSILSIFGLGQDNDPYLARSNSNCLSGDLSECFKSQALNTFDEVFFRDKYSLSEFARIVRLPETQQRSLLQEPFEYSKDPTNTDSDWDQLMKYALRRAERFIKSTALEVDIPVELTEAGRYDARFIGNDIDSELDVIEDKHSPGLRRKKLKKMILPMLLILKIFKLKLLLFLPFILGIVGLKKILSLAAIILPGLFAYFKLCRPPGSGFGGLFGGKTTFPEYSSQGIGPATYYHQHNHYEDGSAPFYRSDPSFSKPAYTDYYSKNYETTPTGNSVSFGDSQQSAYSGYYARNSGRDVQSTQKS